MKLAKKAGWWLRLLLLAWPAVAPAQFTFTTNNGGITITGWSGTNGIVVIPDSINGYPVTRIGTNAFGFLGYGIGYNSAGLTNVIIGPNVTDIGPGAFEDCINLTNVTIGNKVTDIESGAFEYCPGLANLTIPDSVTNLGDFAFAECSSLSQVALGIHVTSLGDGTFNGCSRLTNVTLPDSVAQIGSEAFAGCSALTAITVGAQNRFFSSSQGVLYSKRFSTLVAVPGAILGQYTVMSGATNIDSEAFYGCSNLTSITIPNGVSSIGSGAFDNCAGLTQVMLGTSVASIGTSAFNGCSSLTDITIPQSVTNLGASFLELGSKHSEPPPLKRPITPAQANPILVSAIQIGPLYSGPTDFGSEQMFAGCSNLTAINVASKNKFYSSSRGILFNKSQTTLIEAPGAIAGNYTVPSSVTTIGEAAFASCPGLTGLSLPDSVASIGYGAFGDCTGLTNITLGAHLANLGSYAFANCTGLTRLAIQNGVTNIGIGAFSDCGGLTNVTLGTRVTTIEDTAFAGCAELTGLVIPDSVTNLGSEAFDDCSSLTNIALGAHVDSIGEAAFAGCSSLAAITVAAQNLYFSSAAGVLFDKHQDLLIEAPAGGIVGGYTVPGSVTRIADEAFAGCTNLTSLTIQDSVTNLAAYALNDCPNLIQIYCEGNAPHVDSTGPGLSPFPLLPPTIVVQPPTFLPPYDFHAYNFNSNQAVYYRPGTTGWGTTFEGMPAYMLAPPWICTPTNGTLTIVGTTGLVGTLTIPDAISGMPVTRISSAAFVSDDSLTNVIIGTNITDLGPYTFGGCTNLTGITIPLRVTNIEAYAFAGCINLSSVKIPDGVANIGSQAFYDCRSLSSVTIPASVTYLGDEAFAFCNNLKTVYFAGNAPSTGFNVFEGGIVIITLANLSGFQLVPIIYYLPDTQGWGTTFAGRPTVLWNPQVKPGDPAFGVQNNQFGFNITGASNLVVVVEACANFDRDVWTPISTNQLNRIVGTNGTSYFSDPQWTNYPARFYRFRSP
jgi:hypothetical protein